MFRPEYYIVVSSANSGAFARVGPYQSENDAKKAASFSAIKRYHIEQQGQSRTPREALTYSPPGVPPQEPPRW